MTSCVGLESLAVEPGLGSGRRKLSFRCSREPSSLHSSWLLGFPTSSRYLGTLNLASSRLSWKQLTSSCAPAGPERSSWKAGLGIGCYEHWSASAAATGVAMHRSSLLVHILGTVEVRVRTTGSQSSARMRPVPPSCSQRMWMLDRAYVNADILTCDMRTYIHTQNTSIHFERKPSVSIHGATSLRQCVPRHRSPPALPCVFA